MEGVGIQGRHTPLSSPQPSFFVKGRIDVEFIDRMVKAGLPLDCAERITAGYIAQGDIDGLEAYVTALEAKREVFTVQP